MNPQLLQNKAATTPASDPRPERPCSEQTTNGDDQRPCPVGNPDAPTTKEKLLRSEALARSLAGASSIGEMVAIIKEHGRPAAARAAAVRPDLVPLINGEFPHIALSLADLD